MRVGADGCASFEAMDFGPVSDLYLKVERTGALPNDRRRER
jgi:hypothetical protein